MTQRSYYLTKLKLILALSSAIITTSANNVSAQNITIDGTLSPAQTLNGPDYTIPQSVGQTVGSNLFHSFGQFSLIEGESATFQSNANIRNIFSRVTGGYPSNIDGLIFTQNRSVNLYLINPSGIVFGPNARLNVGGSTRGSFVATTADALVWSNGSQFSATNPGGISTLLTIVGDPSGFLFNHRPPQPIQTFGSPLGVFEGQSLLFLGGDLSLENSALFVRYTEGGRIELGGVAEPGTVGLTTNGNILSLNFPKNLTRANVSLTNATILDAIAGDGGSIAINSRNIEILGGSRVAAGIGTGLGNVNSRVGDITLNASEAIRIDNGSQIENNVNSNSTGNAGNVRLMANSVYLTNGARLTASTYGQGNAGSVIIDAREVSFNSSATVFSRVEQGAVGNGGNISISTDSLSLSNGAQLTVSTFGTGNAGSVIIDAQQVFLDGTISDSNFGSAVFSTVEPGAVGDSGNISITTDFLSLINGAQLTTSTFGRGNAGNVIVDAQQVFLDGTTSNSNLPSAIFTSVGQEAVGSGGNISITTDLLSLTNSAGLNASTFGRGNAGNIIVDAQQVFLDGTTSNGNLPSAIFTSVGQEAVGSGGNLSITTDLLSLTNSAGLNASTFGQGNAGNVIVDAREVTFDRSSAFNTVESRAVGRGGDISITTDLLSLTNGTQLSTSTVGQGNAGSVIIDAHAVSLDGSTISSTVDLGAVGNGGNISITTDSLYLTNDTLLNTSTDGQGNAGSVIIDARKVSFEQSNVNSGVGRVALGKGGNISITTDLLALTNDSELNTSTYGQGNGGSVIIDAYTVSFDERSTVFSTVDYEAIGNGGNISISADLLAFTNGAGLNTGTNGPGNAGSVIIDAREVTFDRSTVFSAAGSGVVGEGGNISITTNSLTLKHGAEINASTFGQGNAGNIQITAFDEVSISGTDSTSDFSSSSGIFTFTDTVLIFVPDNISSGRSGNITINTNLFRLSDNAVLDARTNNDRNGGNITVNARSFEILNGGQLITNTSGRGSAGKITVNATNRLIVNGRDANFNDRVARFGTRVANVDAASGLFVRSDGLGSAGNIEVNSPFVLLDNGGRFIAESRSVNGGNISVNAGDTLLLRRGSQISTTAGTAQSGGNGGNININAGFVIALPNENSNITANAFSGTGGQVQINTQGIFGIEPRLNDSINSSDITASSTTGINGEIVINTPNVDPTQGLTNLPADTVNTASLVDSGCTAFDDKTGSQFNVTGRGGLPASPDDVLSGDAVWSDTRLTLAAKPQNGLVSRVATPQKSSNTISIVPATAWVFNNQGEVTLVSQVAKADAYNVGSNQVACVKP